MTGSMALMNSLLPETEQRPLPPREITQNVARPSDDLLSELESQSRAFLGLCDGCRQANRP